jgi:hypothetical protein
MVIRIRMRKIRTKKGQWKIQQMAFMIVAVFFFFILVGLAFLGFQGGKIKSDFEDLQKEKTISSISIVANMPELNCAGGKDLCLDEDKLLIMSSKTNYAEFWPVSSIEVRKILNGEEEVLCRSGNQESCNYYNVYDSSDSFNSEFKKFSTYVSVCKKMQEFSSVYDKCEIGKLIVGVKS